MWYSVFAKDPYGEKPSRVSHDYVHADRDTNGYLPSREAQMAALAAMGLDVRVWKI